MWAASRRSGIFARCVALPIPLHPPPRNPPHPPNPPAPLPKLWIQRINAATVEHNLNYSRFMNGLAEADVQLNRKVLSELAIHEPKSFQALCELSFRRHREAQQGLKGLL